MKLIYFLFFLIVQLIISQSIYSQESNGDSLSVDQVVRMVLHNNPTVQKGIHQLEASQAILGQSRSKLYPNISGIASYSRIGPLEQLTIPDFGTFSLYPANNYDAHLGLQQLIYDFGRRYRSINLSETETKSAGDRLDKIKSDLAYQAIYAFYTILFLHENIRVLDEQIFDLNQHLDVTEKKVKAGTAINYDVLTTQVRVAAAKSQRENVINLLEKQKIILRQLMSVPEDIPLDLIGKIEIKNVELNSDSLVVLAESQRIDFKLAQDAHMAAAIRHSITRRGHYPLISMNLLYGFKNGYIPDLNVMKANWVAGIRLDMPIFEGFRIRYEKEQTYAELNAAGASMEETRNMIISQVKQAISDIQTSLIQVKTTQIQLEQATEAKSMAETQYNIGVISNLELLDSQTLLTQARFNYLKSKYAWILDYYTLEQAIGTKQW
jgi:outer membrane protein